MIKELTEQDLIQADEIAAKAARAYSEHVYTQKLYEGLCKDFLASLKMNLRDKLQKCSESELESRARATLEWGHFRASQMETLRESGRAKIKYDNAIRRWETIRTCLANKRAEVKRFGS